MSAPHTISNRILICSNQFPNLHTLYLLISEPVDALIPRRCVCCIFWRPEISPRETSSALTCSSSMRRKSSHKATLMRSGGLDMKIEFPHPPEEAIAIILQIVNSHLPSYIVAIPVCGTVSLNSYHSELRKILLIKIVVLLL
ncbi:uncharacterized protein LOC108836382 [Raphanus sativus]|uniref:Uncharacterized protein LOC108836382 n=1 Tax=Raphanus sativus TaxID=3726 RepID=A0A9W3D4X0_RAPSA|nr:uncharacterized protein LOC108836382 [Raphanus sativus]